MPSLRYSSLRPIGWKLMAKLRFFHGLMGAGKSTLALQMVDNAERAGQKVALLTGLSRDGKVTSRIGASREAVSVADGDNIGAVIIRGGATRVVVDEAQFLDVLQVKQLWEIAEYWRTPVDCFGLLTDFRTRLFPGSQRLVELADEVNVLPADVSCWCGETARVNARISNGRVLRDGPTVQVGDLDDSYQVLCLRHWASGEVA